MGSYRSTKKNKEEIKWLWIWGLNFNPNHTMKYKNEIVLIVISKENKDRIRVGRR